MERRILFTPFGKVVLEAESKVLDAVLEWLEEDTCWKRVRNYLRRWV